MESFNENVIEWLRSDKQVSVTLTPKQRLYRRVEELATTHKEIEIHKNLDGVLSAHLPLSWIKINPPRELSDDQKEIMRQRFIERVHERK